MKLLLIIITALALSSCEFEKADYYEYRYGSNIDFGEDTGNSSGSSFDFGSSSYRSSSTRNTRLYMGDTGGKKTKNAKTDYSRFYRGTTDED